MGELIEDLHVNLGTCSQATSTQYESFSELLIDGFRSKLQNRIRTLDSFSADITSFTKETQTEWPLVELPDFSRKGLAARQQAEISALGFLPLVEENDRERWEAFVVENKDWIRSAREWEQARASSLPSSYRNLQKQTLVTRGLALLAPAKRVS